jgi:uncharacterized protein (TIGR02186 family)
MKNGIVAAAAAALIGLAGGTASATLTAKANHDHITIDFFYHGSSVSVRGQADPDVDLVIKIAQPNGHEVMKQKGKKGGFLWMNVGTLTFGNVPQLYEVHSTKPIAALLGEEERTANAIGYEALARHAEIAPLKTEEEKARWFGEFVKYKESSQLYASSVGKITFSEDQGKHTYFINTPWPYQAPPGDYLVTVYAVRDGKVVEQAESRVLVEQVGTVKALSSMAKNHGALYGLLSIMVALGAGFGVGLVFRKGGGAH